MARESDRPKPSAVSTFLEILGAALLFAAAGAWPAPDVNETVYLTKARHWADPSWVRGDFFLETPDAHGVFYTFIGPLAAAVPLETAAWIGRTLGWLALAAGFRAAVAPLVATVPGRLASAAIFSLAVRSTTAAGEWVIGGCEAKVFAWALALAAFGAAWTAGFARAWLWGGAATAFHAIVGGWTMIALVLSRVIAPRAWAGSPDDSRRGFSAVLLFTGFALAATGVVPAWGLGAGSTMAERSQATTIYVVERLPHHLLPRTFAGPLVARHLLAVAVWWLLARMVPQTQPRRRVEVLTLTALGISFAGLTIAAAEPLAPAVVHGLLRFYWFRLGDVVLPFALAVAAAAVLEDEAACRRIVPARPQLTRGAASLLLALDLGVQAAHWPLPGRSGQAARSDAQVQAAAWVAACEWVRDHTPPEAVFLTPRNAASFTWRTGRREVVAWKNSPQDAGSLLEWRRRFVDCFSRDGSLVALERSTADLGAGRLREVAERYEADHAIVPLTACGADALPFERLYQNAAYAVFRLVPAKAFTASRPVSPP